MYHNSKYTPPKPSLFDRVIDATFRASGLIFCAFFWFLIAVVLYTLATEVIWPWVVAFAR